MQSDDELIERLTRPIIDMNWRTPQEVFDIMVDRIRAEKATLTAENERLREALRPYAAIVPSSLYPADGSENEPYVCLLQNHHSNPVAYTGGDLARARQALGGDHG